ncbi:MAG: LD-carboxypeptidase [Chitinophagaceae bacterium]
MNRKEFLTSTSTLLAVGSLPVMAPAHSFSTDPVPQIPPYLEKGDLIGITSPAGYLLPGDMIPTIRQLEAWGFRVLTGVTIGKRSGSLAGTDEERLADIQSMLDNPEVKAIFCARGGYGSVRIVEQIDWSRFRKRPKWILGFSDITVLHSYINRNIGVASLHSKMGNAFPADPLNIDQVIRETAESIRQALTGGVICYPVKPHARNRQGIAQGVLVGGNLKTLESLSGSKSDLDTRNKILFVEDVGEYLYSIDRMFWNLKQTGKLEKLAGLVIGGFRMKPMENPEEEFGLDLYDIVLEKVKGQKYPVCFDFPVGHQKNNYALKCGVRHKLVVGGENVSLTENL